MNIDLLAFPGHKGLLGPQGTGGLYIRPGVEDRVATIREG
jgi:selenocysteine lyase/cysteine desulfurase